MDKQLNIGYGVLDMRVGQGLDKVAYQLERLVKKPIVECYFDIIHTPNQTPKAMEVIGYVKDMIRHATKLPSDSIILHLNVNDKKLRAQNELYKKAYEANVQAVEQKVLNG